VLGIGAITASATYAAGGDGKAFVNGHHFSAWLGLVPGQHSTGGKLTLLGISKRGNTSLRTLTIPGARSVLRYSAGKTDRFSLWAQEAGATGVVEGLCGKGRSRNSLHLQNLRLPLQCFVIAKLF
jgi:transposase